MALLVRNDDGVWQIGPDVGEAGLVNSVYCPLVCSFTLSRYGLQLATKVASFGQHKTLIHISYCNEIDTKFEFENTPF